MGERAKSGKPSFGPRNFEQRQENTGDYLAARKYFPIRAFNKSDHDYPECIPLFLLSFIYQRLEIDINYLRIMIDGSVILIIITRQIIYMKSVETNFTFFNFFR